jgi:prepilin signal peptidase PulO-like enzyme (type II secretory pathway)
LLCWEASSIQSLKMILKRDFTSASVGRQWAVFCIAAAGLALAVIAVVRHGLDAGGLAWAASIALLTPLAATDVVTRRVPNAVTLPAGLVIVALRLAFQRGELAETLIAAAVAFAVFLLLAVLMRGGLGMGDVKLAALIGLLLGRSATEALFIGILAGGIASLAIYTRTRSRRTTLAYAPYLCGGAALVIAFATDIPALV